MLRIKAARAHWPNLILLAALTVAGPLATTRAAAQVTLLNRPGARVAIRDLRFTDESGSEVALASYFHSPTPVILALVYYECPGVCTAVLNGMFENIKRSGLTPGKAYETVVISIAPAETPTLAMRKKAAYLEASNISAGTPGFHFLVGRQPQIEKIAGELGFLYEEDAASGRYYHPAALFILTPDGTLAHTLEPARMTTRGFRSALAGAADGKTDGFFGRFAGACLNRLPASGRWQLVVEKLRAWLY